MSGILIYAEGLGTLCELKTAAAALAGGCSVAAFAATPALAEDAAAYMDAYHAGCKVPTHDAHATARAIAQAAEALGCDTVLLPADRLGKDLAGHVAYLMQAEAVTGIVSVGEGGIVAHGSLGGALIEEDRLGGEKRVYAIAPRAFAPAEPAQGSVSALSIDVPAAAVSVVSSEKRTAAVADIASADVVVAVGCGFENQADMAAVERLAEKIGGVVGCTKPIATDRKWLPEDCVIGISGKTCRPSLALCIGISGQVQFWAGIRDAATVVSINSDANAAIVSLSDASVVMDGVQAVSRLLEVLP